MLKKDSKKLRWVCLARIFLACIIDLQRNKNMKTTLKLKKFIMSFVNAGKGIISGFMERNMRVHGLATGLVFILGSWLKLNKEEWLIILLLIASIWSAELANTAIEELANIVRDELKLSYEATRRARDTAAGAVLILAIVAVIIALLIFAPKIILKFSC